MERRTWTAVAAGLLALTICVLGATLPVPMVALGPGPTYDTLGDVDGTPVVAVDGLPVYPTSGHLNMTTVSVTDRLTMFSALGFWAARNSQVIPREPIFPSDLSTEEIQQENQQQFTSSEINAESAALAELGIPVNVLVADVLPGSPAAAVLRPGDELISVANVPIDAVRKVTEALTGTRPGDVVTISFQRDGVVENKDIALSSRPDRVQGFLGVVLAGTARDADVRIALGGIGGPSAGLMFALALFDKLTPGELAGGRFIAGTGGIDPTGVVTKISGIPFKMVRARESGASDFLVPAENCEEALATAPKGLHLIRVDSLHAAVAALDALDAGQPTPSC
jgi:PDZ domain-containing protein